MGLNTDLLLAATKSTYIPQDVTDQRGQTLRSAMLANDQAEAVNPQILRENAQKLQLGAQGVAGGDIELQQKQIALKDQQLLGQIYAKRAQAAAQASPAVPGQTNPAPSTGGMIDGGFINEAAAAGVSGAGINGLTQQVLKQQETKSIADKNNAEASHFGAETKKIQVEQSGNSLNALLQVAPENRAAAWPTIRGQLVNNGYLTADHAPEAYPGDDTIQLWTNQARDATKVLDDQIKTNAEKRAAAMAPFLQREAANKATVSDLGLAGQMNPDNPEAQRLAMTTEQRTAADQAKAALVQTTANQQQERKQEQQRISIAGGELGIRQQTFNATFGSGLDANGRPLSPEDRKTVAMRDPLTVAQANYQVPPPNRTSAVGKSQYEKLLAINPSYDGTLFPLRNKTAQAYSAGGSEGLKITSNDQALSHLGQLSRAGQALDTGNYKLLNSIAQEIGVQIGTSPKATYDTIVSLVSPEISKSSIGGVGGEHDRAQTYNNYGSDLAPQIRENNIAATANIIGTRYQKMRDAYESDMKKPLDRQLSPESQALLQKYTRGGSAAGTLPKGQGKAADVSTIQTFINASGGDKDKARKLLGDNGWTIPAR